MGFFFYLIKYLKNKIINIYFFVFNINPDIVYKNTPTGRDQAGRNLTEDIDVDRQEAYVSKMVKVNENDRWSLIALGNNRTKSVELKFVDVMKRKYEFSVDSFHIILDTLFLFYECAKERR